MFKYAHKTTPITFSSFFTLVISIHTRTTRLASYSNYLYLPRYKTNELQRSFKFQGVKIWNSIPNDLPAVSSVAKRTLTVREVWGSIPGPVKSTQCRQRLATAATFLRSCVAQAPSRGDGPRNSLHASA